MLHRFLCVLALLQAVVAGTLKGGSACGIQRVLCINATIVDNNIIYEVTPMVRQHVGWIGIGFGKRMPETHMVLMWKNDDGSVTLSQRYADAHREPAYIQDPPRLAQLADPFSPPLAANDTNPRFTFTIPMEEGADLSAQPLIYAIGGIRPKSPSPDTHVTHHITAGPLTLDLTKTLSDNTPVDSTPAPVEESNVPFTSRNWLIVAHATLLSLGFLVFLPLGSLVARWTRSYSPAWFKTHRLFNLYASLPVILGGWLLGPLSVWKAGGVHLSDSHQLSGVIVIVVYLLQLRLGHYIHTKRMSQATDSNRSAHPASNILHAICGLFVMSISFFQVRSGFGEWKIAFGSALPRWPIVSLTIWITVVFLAYIGGLVMLPRQFKNERNMAESGASKHIALSDTADSSARSASKADTEESRPLYSIGNDSTESVDGKQKTTV